MTPCNFVREKTDIFGISSRGDTIKNAVLINFKKTLREQRSWCLQVHRLNDKYLCGVPLEVAESLWDRENEK